MSSQVNLDQVAKLQDKLTKAQSVVVVEYVGTSVKEQTELRRKVREAGGEVVVAKNTLLDIAIGRGKLSESLRGMTAAIFSYADPVAPIKALFEFHKKAEKLEIRQGWMDNSVLSAQEVESLSKLPSKQELLAKLLGVLQNPARNLVGVLNAVPRQLVYAISAVEKKQQGAS
jgi:large subunit ribosomal protein L10